VIERRGPAPFYYLPVPTRSPWTGAAMHRTPSSCSHMIDANPQPVSEFGTQPMELRRSCKSRYDLGEFTPR
jgi:hypothetical protein